MGQGGWWHENVCGVEGKAYRYSKNQQEKKKNGAYVKRRSQRACYTVCVAMSKHSVCRCGGKAEVHSRNCRHTSIGVGRWCGR